MATVEETTAKVQRLLGKLFSGVTLWEDGFRIQLGSSAVHVSVKPWGERNGQPETIVHIVAPVLFGANRSPELYEWVAVDGQMVHFGRATVRPHFVDDKEDPKRCNLYLDVTILGDHLDEPELGWAVALVVDRADKLDDELLKKFGGRRWADVVAS